MWFGQVYNVIKQRYSAIATVKLPRIRSQMGDNKIRRAFLEAFLLRNACLGECLPFHCPEQPFHSAYALADIIDVSHAMILTHFRNSPGIKLLHLLWMQNQLTEQLRASRIRKCQELLLLLERMEANKFGDILTGDESWFMLSISTP
jgi:hypothetical protein